MNLISSTVFRKPCAMTEKKIFPSTPFNIESTPDLLTSQLYTPAENL
jgi:hypothetical protein